MEYFGLIFTKHALSKMNERGIKKEDAWETFKHPDHHFEGRKKDTYEFKKNFGKFELTVIAAQNRQNEWVTISVWRDPPLEGTADEREQNNWRNYKNAGFFGKIFFGIKRQLGL